MDFRTKHEDERLRRDGLHAGGRGWTIRDTSKFSITHCTLRSHCLLLFLFDDVETPYKARATLTFQS